MLNWFKKNKWVSVTEGARQIGVSRQSLYNWVKSGKMKFHRIAGFPVISQSEVNRLKR